MNKIQSEAWTHGQTDRTQGGGGKGDWKRLARGHTCVYAWPMGTDNNVVKAQGGEVGQRGEMGEKWMASIIGSTIKKYIFKYFLALLKNLMDFPKPVICTQVV